MEQRLTRDNLSSNSITLRYFILQYPLLPRGIQILCIVMYLLSFDGVTGVPKYNETLLFSPAMTYVGFAVGDPYILLSVSFYPRSLRGCVVYENSSETALRG